ncbi:hypothetical protein J6590_031952 [Homalodisca vitripennis]|nr:hypothetical protein J6590_031952 [Homalodisca vitripennis]
MGTRHCQNIHYSTARLNLDLETHQLLAPSQRTLNSRLARETYDSSTAVPITHTGTAALFSGPDRSIGRQEYAVKLFNLSFRWLTNLYRPVGNVRRSMSFENPLRRIYIALLSTEESVGVVSRQGCKSKGGANSESRRHLRDGVPLPPPPYDVCSQFAERLPKLHSQLQCPRPYKTHSYQFIWTMEQGEVHGRTSMKYYCTKSTETQLKLSSPYGNCLRHMGTVKDEENFLRHMGTVKDEEIRYLENILLTELPSLNNLVEMSLQTSGTDFTLPTCSDEILEKIGSSCPRLRTLNISYTHTQPNVEQCRFKKNTARTVCKSGANG